MSLTLTAFAMKPTTTHLKSDVHANSALSRNSTAAGRKVLKNRRRKGRAKLSASVARRFR